MSGNDSSVDEEEGLEIEAAKLDDFESLFRGVAPTNCK